MEMSIVASASRVLSFTFFSSRVENSVYESKSSVKRPTTVVVQSPLQNVSRYCSRRSPPFPGILQILLDLRRAVEKKKLSLVGI